MKIIKIEDVPEVSRKCFTCEHKFIKRAELFTDPVLKGDYCTKCGIILEGVEITLPVDYASNYNPLN